MTDEQTLQRAGYPVRFQKVGSAYGSGAAAGLWLLPCVRVRATYPYQKAARENRLDLVGGRLCRDHLEFRIRETGAEAAVRFPNLHGFIIGANAAQGRAEADEDPFQDAGSPLWLAGTAEQTKSAYGGYVGFDQSGASGVVGHIVAGLRYSDMGHMPSTSTLSDGDNCATQQGKTVWMDYSGLYLKVGIGYDTPR